MTTPRAPSALVIAALAAALALAWWWTHPPDPARALRAHAAPLARLERAAVSGGEAGLERWRLIDTRGDTANALWRAAAAGTPGPWTVVMLGGLGTGERAALLLPADVPVNALALDWPWSGPTRLSPLEVAIRLGAIRDAVLKSPGVLALGVQAVAAQPGVDRTRIVLLGASLGVPPAVAAMRLTSRPSALVLIDGAADLPGLLRAGLVREGVPAPIAGPLASLAGRLIRPLEPALNAPAAPARVMLENAERDELQPRTCIDRLHEAFPSATVRWRAEPHLRPTRLESIAAMAHDVAGWLDAAEASAPRSAGPRPRRRAGRPGARRAMSRRPRRIGLCARGPQAMIAA